MKMKLLTFIGVVGSWIACLFGGWDAALVTLMIFMGIDYVTGLIVAGVFKASEKTENGALESTAGWKGLCRKGVTFSRSISHGLLLYWARRIRASVLVGAYPTGACFAFPSASYTVT